MSGIPEEVFLYNYYAGKRESNIKKDIKREKNYNRRIMLENIYTELKQNDAFKKKN